MGLIDKPLFRLNWFFRPSSSVRTAMLALHPGGALHGTHTLWCGGSLIAFSGRSSIRSGISSSSSAVTESPPASPVTSSSSSSPDPTPSSASLSLGGPASECQECLLCPLIDGHSFRLVCLFVCVAVVFFICTLFRYFEHLNLLRIVTIPGFECWLIFPQDGGGRLLGRGHQLR